MAHQVGLRAVGSRNICKIQDGLSHNAEGPSACAFAPGTRTITDLADDYAVVYAPYIQAAVMEVGNNYRQVAKWLTRERIPAQRAGSWAAQSVKNLVVRYWYLTGKRLLIPYKRFPTPAHRKASGWT